MDNKDLLTVPRTDKSQTLLWFTKNGYCPQIELSKEKLPGNMEISKKLKSE